MQSGELMYYGDLTSEEVYAAARDRCVVLPLGAIEQHGPHLPLSVDLDIARAIAIEVARRLGGIVAPAVAYGARSLPYCGGGGSFPGTVYSRGTALIEYLSDIVAGYAAAGTRELAVINGHYENEAFLFEALDVLRCRGVLEGMNVTAFSWWNAVDDRFIRELFEAPFPGWHAEHAGVCETSLMLHLRPNLVRPLRIDHDRPPACGVYLHPQPSSGSTRGVLSRTSGSNAAAGEALFLHIVERACRLVGARHATGERQNHD